MKDEATKTDDSTEVGGRVDPLVSHLREALAEANEVLRSAYQIAARQGRDTNWDVYIERLHDVLAKQHAIMYPDGEHVASAGCWCNPELDYIDPETGNAVYVHKQHH